jgi:hypothetical protein
VEVHTTDDAAALNVLAASGWAAYLQKGRDPIRLRMDKKRIPQLAAYLVEHQMSILSLQTRHRLEDYFLSLTSSNQHVAAYQD